MNLSKAELRNLIDERYIKRGEDIVHGGTIILDKIGSDSIEAYAVGTGIYHIRLWRSAPGKIDGTCNCRPFLILGRVNIWQQPVLHV